MKITNEVLAVLAAATTAGPLLYLPGQLDRALYQATNKVLEANGGKWSRRDKAHRFEGEAADEIEQALLTGEFHRVKQDFGQFDSPPAVVARMIELAEIGPRMLCYEPSAGIGNIVAGIIAVQGTGAHVFANEIDEKRRAKCIERNYRAFGGGGISCRDFLEIQPPLPDENLKFDRVLMNPPFAKQADIDHVLHALKFLRPGGRLVAVMSAAVTFRHNRKTTDFWKWVQRHRECLWEALPAGSFAPSGTNVHAILLRVDV